MFKKINKKLKGNENALVAIEAFLHSKSAFGDMFLLTYIARISATDNPIAFSTYKIIEYLVLTFFAIVIVKFVKKYMLSAFRASFFVGIVKVLIIILLGDQIGNYLFLVGIIHGIEASLFWRPYSYFSIIEVPNRNRMRFETKKVVFGSLAKILSPVILGLVIADTDYISTGGLILAVSLLQLILSLVFRPSRDYKSQKTHSLYETLKKIRKLKRLRKVFWIQFLRGTFVSGAAISTIMVMLMNQAFRSDVDLGFFTTVAAIATIILFLAYDKLIKLSSNGSRFVAVCAMIVAGLATSMLFATGQIITATCYIGFLTFLSIINAVCSVKLHNVIRAEKSVRNHVFEIESISEVILNAGRIPTFVLLIVFGATNEGANLPILVFIYSLTIVPLTLLLMQSDGEKKRTI